jgi:hypothetical protein
MLKLIWWLALVCFGATFPKESLAIGQSILDALVALYRAASAVILA